MNAMLPPTLRLDDLADFPRLRQDGQTAPPLSIRAVGHRQTACGPLRGWFEHSRVHTDNLPFFAPNSQSPYMRRLALVHIRQVVFLGNGL